MLVQRHSFGSQVGAASRILFGRLLQSEIGSFTLGTEVLQPQESCFGISKVAPPSHTPDRDPQSASYQHLCTMGPTAQRHASRENMRISGVPSVRRFRSRLNILSGIFLFPVGLWKCLRLSVFFFCASEPFLPLLRPAQIPALSSINT
jgi:hypothetical protein